MLEGLQPEVVVPLVVVPVVPVPVPVVVVVDVVVPEVPLVVVPAEVVPLVPLLVDPPVPLVEVPVVPLPPQPAASSATVQQRMDALITTGLFIAEFSLNAGRKGHQREPAWPARCHPGDTEAAVPTAPHPPWQALLGVSKRQCSRTNVDPANPGRRASFVG
jgi:hypothetical protein